MSVLYPSWCSPGLLQVGDCVHFFFVPTEPCFPQILFFPEDVDLLILKRPRSCSKIVHLFASHDFRSVKQVMGRCEVATPQRVTVLTEMGSDKVQFLPHEVCLTVILTCEKFSMHKKFVVARRIASICGLCPCGVLVMQGTKMFGKRRKSFF